MDQELVCQLYQEMQRIRRFEEEAARMYTERKIGGFLHLYIGQEAVAVGAISVLEDVDTVITAYRCHGHYLTRGGSCRAGFSELLGKVTGCAEGRGGSMHFYNVDRNFFGGWGIVGAQVPLGAGMAFAHKYKKDGGVNLAFMGDGAINIGSFHEGLSLAALWRLPSVFIIENNEFAMGTPISKTSPVDDLSIRALGIPMARDVVNGHDVFAVRESVHAAVRRAREQSLPTLIEAKTYRYRGHSMADPATYRKKEDVEERKKQDCIQMLADTLKSLGLQTKIDQINDAVEKEIQEALEFAEAAPFPEESDASKYVYSDSSQLELAH